VGYPPSFWKNIRRKDLQKLPFVNEFPCFGVAKAEVAAFAKEKREKAHAFYTQLSAE
jgi:hypothetical protein